MEKGSQEICYTLYTFWGNQKSVPSPASEGSWFPMECRVVEAEGWGLLGRRRPSHLPCRSPAHQTQEGPRAASLSPS